MTRTEFYDNFLNRNLNRKYNCMMNPEDRLSNCDIFLISHHSFMRTRSRKLINAGRKKVKGLTYYGEDLLPESLRRELGL